MKKMINFRGIGRFIATLTAMNLVLALVSENKIFAESNQVRRVNLNEEDKIRIHNIAIKKRFIETQIMSSPEKSHRLKVAIQNAQSLLVKYPNGKISAQAILDLQTSDIARRSNYKPMGAHDFLASDHAWTMYSNGVEAAKSYKNPAGMGIPHLAAISLGSNLSKSVVDYVVEKIETEHDHSLTEENHSMNTLSQKQLFRSDIAGVIQQIERSPSLSSYVDAELSRAGINPVFGVSAQQIINTNPEFSKQLNEENYTQKLGEHLAGQTKQLNHLANDIKNQISKEFKTLKQEIENQHKDAQKAAEDKAKVQAENQAKQQRRLTDIEVTTQLASTIASVVGEPKAAQAIDFVGGAAVKLIDAYAKNKSDPKLVSDFAMSAMSLNYAVMAVQLGSALFGPKQVSTDEIIMGMLADISKQIFDLHEAVLDGFRKSKLQADINTYQMLAAVSDLRDLQLMTNDKLDTLIKYNLNDNVRRQENQYKNTLVARYNKFEACIDKMLMKASRESIRDCLRDYRTLRLSDLKYDVSHNNVAIMSPLAIGIWSDDGISGLNKMTSSQAAQSKQSYYSEFSPLYEQLPLAIGLRNSAIAEINNARVDGGQKELRKINASLISRPQAWLSYAYEAVSLHTAAAKLKNQDAKEFLASIKEIVAEGKTIVKTVMKLNFYVKKPKSHSGSQSKSKSQEDYLQVNTRLHGVLLKQYHEKLRLLFAEAMSIGVGDSKSQAIGKSLLLGLEQALPTGADDLKALDAELEKLFENTKSIQACVDAPDAHFMTARNEYISKTKNVDSLIEHYYQHFVNNWKRAYVNKEKIPVLSPAELRQIVPQAILWSAVQGYGQIEICFNKYKATNIKLNSRVKERPDSKNQSYDKVLAHNKLFEGVHEMDVDLELDVRFKANPSAAQMLADKGQTGYDLALNIPVPIKLVKTPVPKVQSAPKLSTPEFNMVVKRLTYRANNVMMRSVNNDKNNIRKAMKKLMTDMFKPVEVQEVVVCHTLGQKCFNSNGERIIIPSDRDAIPGKKRKKVNWSKVAERLNLDKDDLQRQKNKVLAYRRNKRLEFRSDLVKNSKKTQVNSTLPNVVGVLNELYKEHSSESNSLAFEKLVSNLHDSDKSSRQAFVEAKKFYLNYMLYVSLGFSGIVNDNYNLMKLRQEDRLRSPEEFLQDLIASKMSEQGVAEYLANREQSSLIYFKDLNMWLENQDTRTEALAEIIPHEIIRLTDAINEYMYLDEEYVKKVLAVSK